MMSSFLAFQVSTSSTFFRQHSSSSSSTTQSSSSHPSTFSSSVSSRHNISQSSFVHRRSSLQRRRCKTRHSSAPLPAHLHISMVDQAPKISPVPVETTDPNLDNGILELTEANVEMVLDEMRPYLISDGGNVSIAEIDGATVRLQLEGACGSCPSSTMTMKMGLERRLKERIPEIEEVVQVEPEGPELNAEGIEKTLDEVRPFLNVAGGTIELIELNAESAAPSARLRMTGSGAAINSVKVEIVHRLKRNWVKLANVTFE